MGEGTAHARNFPGQRPSIPPDPQSGLPVVAQMAVYTQQRDWFVLHGAVVGRFTEDASHAGGQAWCREPPRVSASGSLPGSVE